MKTLFNWICLVIIIFIMIMAASCNSTKHLEESSASSIEKKLTEANTKIAQLTIENEHYRKQVHDNEDYEVTFDPSLPCPEMNIDSLQLALLSSGCRQETIDSALKAFDDINIKYRNAQSTIKKLQDGTIEIRGNISSLKASKQHIEETLIETNKRDSILKEENLRLETELSQKQTLKVKDKESSWFDQWWYFPAGMILMALIIYRKKILSAMRG